MALPTDLLLEHLEHLDQLVPTEILFWLQMTVQMAGLLWCLALASVLVFGEWYAYTHPETGLDHTIRRLAHALHLLTFSLSEEVNPSAEGEEPRGEGSMDKQEAERLVRVIERQHVAWLQVDQIVFNEARNAYELECSYRGPAGFLGSKAVWRRRRIRSPREWIDLLTTHRDTP